MASNRPEKIHTVKQSIGIAIFLKDYSKFKEVFDKEKVYKFHVLSKQVQGRELIFQVRSMRVNEFIDILDLHKIGWRDLKI